MKRPLFLPWRFRTRYDARQRAWSASFDTLSQGWTTSGHATEDEAVSYLRAWVRGEQA